MSAISRRCCSTTPWISTICCCFTVLLLRDNQPIREKYQQKWRYLLVDEFQDTNAAQYELVQLLAGAPSNNRNLFVVGDEDQSIYRFRGADYRNVQLFRRDFPDARGHPARTELPQHADDPRRGEFGHRQQPQPHTQAAAHRQRRRAARACARGVQRSRGSRLRRRRNSEADRLQSLLRRAISPSPIAPTPRAARSKRPLSSAASSTS
jgi:hypothetical protein